MTPQELLAQIQEDLESKTLKHIFARLKEAMKAESEYYDQYILMRGRFNEANESMNTGVLSFPDYQVQVSQIKSAVLSFARKLEAKDLKGEAKEVKLDMIPDPVLVVCSSEESQKEMRTFFELLDFADVKLVQGEAGLGEKAYDLVVFDNRDLPTGRDLSAGDQARLQTRTALMQKYLDVGKEYLVHFGEFLPFVSQNRGQVQAANSKFTLYARIKELLDFRRRLRVD